MIWADEIYWNRETSGKKNSSIFVINLIGI